MRCTSSFFLIAPPRDGGHVATRTFIPHKCHAAIGVLGAVSVGTACVLPGSVARGIASVPEGALKGLGLPVHPAWYEQPVFYFSNPAAIYGPEDEIPYPQGETELDYGLGLAAGVTVSVFCSHAARRAAPARMQMYFFIRL